MDVFAAVMTGQGMGAIATIQLCGPAAQEILRQVFQRRGDASIEVVEGRVWLGHLIDRGEIVDEVTIGCEGPDTFAIHCHGNPLLIEKIMGLLQYHGAQSVPAAQLLARLLMSRKPCNAIAVEAKLALTTVKTTAGAEIIASQVNGGLSQRIAAEAEDILSRSVPARLIVSGCTIALVGPPNTGKSTLLNTLAGREKAIVSDVRGTTRDWVCAEIHLPPLAATVIDTAGLDSLNVASSAVDRTAQQRSVEMIQRADLILLVLDISQPADRLPVSLVEQLIGRRVVTVLNKADLPPRFDSASVPNQLAPAIQISAKQGCGMEDLTAAIHRACGVADFDLRSPVVFTDRQRRLLEALQRCDTESDSRVALSELLGSRGLLLSAP
jgi:tRNA modification GTPase